MAEILYSFGDIIRMRYRGRYYGERFELVQHMRYISTDPRVGHQLTEILPGEFLLNFTSMMVVHCTFYEVGWTKILSDRNLREEIFGLGSIAGTQNQDGMPHQLASLYKTRCEFSGDERPGRLYMPGIPRDRFAGGTFTGAAISQLTQIAEALKAKFSADGSSFHIEWGVLSKINGQRLFLPVRDVSYSTLPATQRSRRPEVH